MEQREKLLAGGLGIAVALWGGMSLYESRYKAPLDAKEQAVSLAQETANKDRAARRKLLMAQKTVRDSRSDSLPPDKIDAQRLYGDWCYSLAELSGWRNLVQKPESTGPVGKIGSRIPVTVTGRATRSQIATFVWHFQQTDLLHRISALDMTSLSNDGDPEFNVVARLEGIAMNDAPSRGRLFPEARLAKPLDATSKTIEVAQLFDAVKPPFRVRLDREFLNVTEVSGTTWTIERAFDETIAAAHDAEQTIQLAPTKVLANDAPSRAEVTDLLLTKSVFVKPAPPVEFRPRMATTVFPPMTRGQPWTAVLKADGWAPNWPAPVFMVSGAPQGMTIKPTGEVTWTPPPELKAGEFKPKFLARAGEVTKFETEVTLILRDPNRPPKFDPVQPLKAIVGQALTYEVAAKDEDIDTKLTYALAGTIPPGMVIDASNGKVTWTPPETQTAGDIAFQITATDNGTPPTTTAQEIKGKVDDDHALYTFLIASIDKGDNRLAWLFDRLANTKIEVRMGDTIKASEMEFTVDSIDSGGIAIRAGKQRLRVNLGQHLRQAKAYPPEAAVPPPPPKAERIQFKGVRPEIRSP